jgi:hypothetical protein
VQLRHRGGGVYMENLFSIARASLYLCARFLCVAFSLARFVRAPEFSHSAIVQN